MNSRSEISVLLDDVGRVQDPSLSLEYLRSEGVTVFESVRSYGGILFRLGEHLVRLHASAKTVGLPITKSFSQLKAVLYDALKMSGKKNAFLRLSITAQGIFVVISNRTYPAEIFEEGVRIRTSSVKKSLSRALYPEAKTSCYGGQMLATVEMPADIFEVFFLSEDGCLRETRTSNIFMIKDGLLFTPPPVGILDGVTRRLVIEMARGMALPVQEIDLTRHDLFNADEAFLTNTSGEIIPVREIDGRAVGSMIPGSWTRRLMRRFRIEVHEYCARARKGRQVHVKD